QAADLYYTFAKLAPTMVAGKKPEGFEAKQKDWMADFDFEPDEKHKTVAVTEQGVAKAEKFLGIDNMYRAEHGNLVNHLIQALKAESLYKRDVDYAVIDGEVRIIDEFTGRILEGRRWSEGLHQAIEAKEGVAIAAKLAVRGVDIERGGNAEHQTHVELVQLGVEPVSEEWNEHWDKVFPALEERVEADRQKVLDAGGLYILGTERQESRRIDNQLRGRSGRQGDPGESRFFLSAEDDLIRLF